MKILIVSNLYPPYYVGGYELRCAQVAECLKSRGHDVRVLASSFMTSSGAAESRDPIEVVRGVPVERSMQYRPYLPAPRRFYTPEMMRRQKDDVHRFAQIIHTFQPDVVNWWNMEGMTKIPMQLVADRRIPDACCIDDTWLVSEYGLAGERDSMCWFQFWQGNWGPLPLRPLVRRWLAPRERQLRAAGIPTRPVARPPRNVVFVSEYMRHEHVAANLTYPSTEVIYGGVPTGEFLAERSSSDFQAARLRFLYAGQVNPVRGLHTIVEAINLLPAEVRHRMELTVAASGPAGRSAYVDQVEKRIRELGLSEAVRFLGKVLHADMPRLYREHHVLVFASTREEGLPMTMMEAMCAGLAVITTGSGGAIEIADVAELPLFPKEHPLALSRLMAKLVHRRGLAYEIGRRGQEVILERFTFRQMMDNFCRMFDQLHNEKGAGLAEPATATVPAE